MENDRFKGTPRPPWLPNAHHAEESSPGLLTSIIVITPLRASDSDFTEETTTKDDFSKRPHDAHASPCLTDDPSRRRLAAPISKLSSEEEMGRTHADEGLRYRATTKHVIVSTHRSGSSSYLHQQDTNRKMSQARRNI
jgi:hypothetical protein